MVSTICGKSFSIALALALPL
jgi:hypothetical protein